MFRKYNKFIVLAGILIMVCSFILTGCGISTKDESAQPQNVVEEFTIPAPEAVGEIGINFKTGKLIFTGATQSNEKLAVFGNGLDTLYVYSTFWKNHVSVNIGGKDINNTIPIDDPLNIKIYKTSTNDGTTLYILKRAYDMECDYLIIGRKIDGTFVKYIDTKELTSKYFGDLGAQTTIIYEDKVLIKGSTLSFNCFYYKFGAKNFPGDKACRFNFKWNENTQLFDIEQAEKQPTPKDNNARGLSSNSNINTVSTPSTSSRNTDFLDLTDKELKSNDIFSESDYKLLAKIPKVDFSAYAMGLTVEEFERLIDWPMVEASENATRTLFDNYYEIGLNREQCKHITFYQRKGEHTGGIYQDIIGVKDGIVVIYVGKASGDEMKKIIKHLDVEPLQLQFDYHSSYLYWKGNNCYIAFQPASIPPKPRTFENTKELYNTYDNLRGLTVQYLGDMHYSAYFKNGFPVNMMIGGEQ